MEDKRSGEIIALISDQILTRILAKPFRMSDIVYPKDEEAPYGVARLGEKYTLIDIFDKFPKEERNLVNYYSYLAMSAIVGAIAPMGLHNLTGHKLYHKPHLTILFSGTMFFAAKTIFYYRDQSAKRTEAICRDYIRLHPDRFPPVGKLFDCHSISEAIKKRHLTEQLLISICFVLFLLIIRTQKVQGLAASVVP